jgi:hypothetical protein
MVSWPSFSGSVMLAIRVSIRLMNVNQPLAVK